VQLDEVDETSDGAVSLPCRSRNMMTLLLVARTDSALTQAFRYIFVGAVATVADIYCLHTLIARAHVPYLESAAVAFVVGLIVNYALSIRWVFASRTMGNRTVEFAVFGAIGLAGLGLTELVMWTSVEKLGLGVMLAKLLAVVVVFAWNFGLRRALLFRERRAS